jgi:hypothetical protein
MTAPAVPAAPHHRVPVEHRFLGLDKRTIPFAAVALAVWLLWSVVLPWVNRQVDYTNPVEAGDEVLVSASGVTFTPTPGWDLQQGIRTAEETRNGAVPSTVVLVQDGVAFAVQPGPWTGTAGELLAQVEKAPTVGTFGDTEVDLVGDPTTITTIDGDVGVGQGFTTNRGNGVAAAYVFGEEGILIEVLGTPEQIGQRSQQIVDMIASFTDEEAA